MNLKLEVGKIYECANGRRVRIRVLDGDSTEFPVVGSTIETDGNPVSLAFYSLLGADHSGDPSFRIVRECTQPLQIELPTYKWAAMDEDGQWCVFGSRPVSGREGDVWSVPGDDWARVPGLVDGYYTGDWKDSLHTVESDGTLKPVE